MALELPQLLEEGTYCLLHRALQEVVLGSRQYALFDHFFYNLAMARHLIGVEFGEVIDDAPEGVQRVTHGRVIGGTPVQVLHQKQIEAVLFIIYDLG